MYKSIIIGCLALVVVATGAFAGDLLLRGEVDIPNQVQIEFSIPLDVLDAIKTSGLSAMVDDKGKLNQLVDSLIGDLASMKGHNLLEINMDGHGIAIAVDEVDKDNPEEANFIQLNIDPTGDNEPEINLCIPKGILFLGAFIGNQFVEKHGEEFMDMIKQQMMMNCKPPAAPQGGMGECKDKKCPKDNDDGDDDEDDDDDEIQEKIKKDVNPEKIIKEILREVLKELN